MITKKLADPKEIAKEIFTRNAPKLKSWEISALQDEIAAAIQNERDLLESRLQAIDISAGDAIFLSTPGPFSNTAFLRIMEIMTRTFPENEIIIFEAGMRVDNVLRPKDTTNEPG
jgi:hypothetical protein